MAQRYGLYPKCYGSIVRILKYLRTVVRILAKIRPIERKVWAIIEKKYARKGW